MNSISMSNKYITQTIIHPVADILAASCLSVSGWLRGPSLMFLDDVIRTADSLTTSLPIMTVRGVFFVCFCLLKLMLTKKV